ncbi:MerR family transcriptional regulator [Alloscardovia criceti]|uniref:MerR family transcriptional regulator n=1 Tax=Alloscardovia criceti TaxID=356828 RepID=UPI00035E4018|nr:MerR family transcriptional regulator [Alloscardovia criceti]
MAESNERPQLSLHVRLSEVENLDSQHFVQGTLFEFEDDCTEAGYRGAVASKVAGITYRQLDYWARKHIVEPSITPSSGSGSRRLYSFKDIVILSVAKKLLDAGVNLNNVTKALSFLEQCDLKKLSDVVIMSDGSRIFECASESEMLSFMREGHAVFGISVQAMWDHISQALKNEESVATDHTAHAQTQDTPTVHSIDELTQHRMRRKLELQKRSLHQAQVI